MGTFTFREFSKRRKVQIGEDATAIFCQATSGIPLTFLSEAFLLKFTAGSILSSETCPQSLLACAEAPPVKTDLLEFEPKGHYLCYEEGFRGRKVAQRRISEKHVLRVVYDEGQREIRVVTFYPGRRSRYESSI